MVGNVYEILGLAVKQLAMQNQVLFLQYIMYISTIHCAFLQYIIYDILGLAVEEIHFKDVPGGMSDF